MPVVTRLQAQKQLAQKQLELIPQTDLQREQWMISCVKLYLDQFPHEKTWNDKYKYTTEVFGRLTQILPEILASGNRWLPFVHISVDKANQFIDKINNDCSICGGWEPFMFLKNNLKTK